MVLLTRNPATSMASDLMTSNLSEASESLRLLYLSLRCARFNGTGRYLACPLLWSWNELVLPFCKITSILRKLVE